MPTIDNLNALVRTILILAGGLTLMAMGYIALTDPNTVYPLRGAAVILLVLVLLLNKEKALVTIIDAWWGRGGGEK